MVTANCKVSYHVALCPTSQWLPCNQWRISPDFAVDVTRFISVCSVLHGPRLHGERALQARQAERMTDERAWLAFHPPHTESKGRGPFSIRSAKTGEQQRWRV